MPSASHSVRRKENWFSARSIRRHCLMNEEIQSLLGENRSINFCDLGWGNGFLGIIPKVQASKEKKNIIKMKKLEALKDCNEKMKRPFTEWEKKFANNLSNEKIVPRIYKPLQLSNIKTNNPIFKMSKGSEQTAS